MMGSIRSHLTSELLHHVQAERHGERVERELVKVCTEMLVALDTYKDVCACNISVASCLIMTLRSVSSGLFSPSRSDFMRLRARRCWPNTTAHVGGTFEGFACD